VAEKLVLDRKVTFTGDIQFEEVFEKGKLQVQIEH
jgi:hypothetical protein